MELTNNSPTQAEAADAQDPALGTGQRMRVLAIDDNDAFCTMLTELLEPLGFEVKTAASPVKALELFTREKDSIQLVILDYYMPQLGGAKTFEWLRKLNPDVKVIVCSGAEELRLRQIQAQHKIDGYLQKPFHLQEALQLIHRVTQLPSRAKA
jgi:two-component system, cell cycle sensor histidine kinase and response regulator CckA